jgi:ketosteroid isomerase-like protein
VSDSPNVELVRSIYAAWERSDFDSAEWAAPEIEFVWADGPNPGSWSGLEGMAEANRDWLNAWEQLNMQVDDYREVGYDRVLVLHQFSARGKRSGLELGQMRTEGAGVFHLRDGKVVRIVHYFDRERAFADLGLASEGGSP